MSDLLHLTVSSIKLRQNSLFPCKNGATRYFKNQRGTMSGTQEEGGAVEDAEAPRLTQLLLSWSMQPSGPAVTTATIKCDQGRTLLLV